LRAGYIYLMKASGHPAQRLASQAKADCPECPTGINLTIANSSIQLVAQTLLANCEQVAQIVYNASGDIP
jgi:hypothetical protein